MRVGSCEFSDISTFSFHPVKSITTGEGGMLTTNSKRLYEKIILYRNHCIKKRKIINTNLFFGYKIVDYGFNYRLSDINSALGISQLKRLKTFIKKRNKIANKYYDELSDLKDYVILPKRKEDIESAWHLFVLKINFDKLHISKDVLFKLLYQKGIITQVHYPPLYRHPVFKKLKRNFFIGTEKYFKSCLSIPIYPDLDDKKLRYITTTIKKIFLRSKKN